MEDEFVLGKVAIPHKPIPSLLLIARYCTRYAFRNLGLGKRCLTRPSTQDISLNRT